jgi:hypothetical protein
MAKQQTARSTIGKDPFETTIPDRIGEAEAKLREVPANHDNAPTVTTSKAAQKKEKLTVHLTHELIERVKNAAYWNPKLTIASIAELGVKYAIEQVEKEHGGSYPPRESELKGGRPIGS